MVRGRPGDEGGDGTTTGTSTAGTSTDSFMGSKPTRSPISLQGSSKRISSGDIAGIVIASITLLILLGAVALYLRRHRQAKRRPRVDLLSENGMSEVGDGQSKPFVSGLLGRRPTNGKKVEEASIAGHAQKSDMSNIMPSQPGPVSIIGSGFSTLGPDSSTSSDHGQNPSSFGYYGQGTRDPITAPQHTDAVMSTDTKHPSAEVLNNARDLRQELRNARESRYIISIDGHSGSSTPPTTRPAMRNDSDSSLPPPYPA